MKEKAVSDWTFWNGFLPDRKLPCSIWFQSCKASFPIPSFLYRNLSLTPSQPRHPDADLLDLPPRRWQASRSRRCRRRQQDASSFYTSLRIPSLSDVGHWFVMLAVLSALPMGKSTFLCPGIFSASRSFSLQTEDALYYRCLSELLNLSNFPCWACK